MFPGISFVIPTYNASFHIGRCLKSIKRQNYPQDKIEILILDGGSEDNTLDIARQFGCRIFHNPKKLSEYGVQLGVSKAQGELLTPVAADNELVADDWIEKVVGVFSNHEDVSAVWGRLASAKDDSSLNKYFELIQSDPLNWFLNRNLEKYKNKAVKEGDCFIFTVEPARPLVWGANGIVYRSEKIKDIWAQQGYLGDNDAFQQMVVQGNNRVAYFDSPFVYHHHVAKISDWIKKWRRNYKLHFLDKLKTRNLGWVFVPGFNFRLGLWSVYSLCPVFSGLHCLYLAFRDRSIYWLYHPAASFLQTSVYIYITLTTKEGRNLFKNLIMHSTPFAKERACTS